MIKLTLDDKVIEVQPHLTIKQYMQMQKQPERYKTESQILAFYLGITEDELKGLPVENIQFVSKVLEAHMENPKIDIVYTFMHDGIQYGLENNWGKLTWGQWVDMEVFGHRDKFNESIHILMALLYREVQIENGKTYDLVKFDSNKVLERADKFLELPVSYWFGAANFFFLLSTEYTSLINRSLKQIIKREKWIRPLRKILPEKIQRWLLPDITSSLLTSWPTEILPK
jgi:hypothetical protein